MAFHEIGETVKIPRDEHVMLYVRRVTLNISAPKEQQVECVEIREYIKTSASFGHGVVVPLLVVPDIRVALERLCPKQETV